MNKPQLDKDKIARILGAKRREAVRVPLYYTPAFLGQVREHLQRRLASCGGRPTVAEWKVVRKTRYSKQTWKTLENMAERWSRGGASISPAQVAATIVDEAIGG